MSRKRFTAEQIIGMLREAEVRLSQGKSVKGICRSLGITEQSYRDEVLNREVFYTLQEAQEIIEGWRQEYNTFRPHSSLGYRPPAPGVVLPPPDRIIQPWLIRKGLDKKIV